jgi:hypothetical protein
MTTAQTAPAPSSSLGAPPPAPGETASAEGESRALAGALAFGRAANAVLNGIADAVGVTPYVEAHPYGLLAAALGSGYVAGGGLFTATSARMLGMAMKLAAIPAVRNRLLDAAEAALDSLADTPLGSSTPHPEVTP